MKPLHKQFWQKFFNVDIVTLFITLIFITFMSWLIMDHWWHSYASGIQFNRSGIGINDK